jgi:hypothetical protein
VVSEQSQYGLFILQKEKDLDSHAFFILDFRIVMLLTQILSDKGYKIKALHVIIHHVKSWIRTAYSWVSDKNINRSFDEFCCRINCSQSKYTIFNNLSKRMVLADNVTHENIICA